MTKLDQTTGVLSTNKAQVLNSALCYRTLQAPIAWTK